MTVLVSIRFHVDEADAEAFLAEAHRILLLLAAQSGHVRGSVARAVDDRTRWLMSLQWVDVGAYRRALGAYDVKVVTTPLLSRALDEPSAYEILAGDGATPATPPNRVEPRGGGSGQTVA